MTRDFDKFIEVMQRMVDSGRALHDASKRKCSALAGMNLDAIHQTTEQEGMLTGRMRELNRERRELLETLTGTKGSGSSTDVAHDTGLDRLLERVDEPQRTRLSVLRRELSDVMKDVQFTNVTNSIVSRRSLRHFQELLGLLSGGGPVDRRYNRKGTVTRQIGPSGLVNQIA